MENNIPKITTRETEHLRSLYPSLSHLEAGRVAEWLSERKDQLLELAQEAENEADGARVLGLIAAGVGTVCYAVNPFMLVGGMIGGAAWLWFVVDHYNWTKEIAPLPFVRGNFLDALSRAGDYDARLGYETNHLAETIKFLPRRDAIEYVFLHSDFLENVIDYLAQVEPGKRFYAYRWLLGWFEKFKGRSIPQKEVLAQHLENVTIDSRIQVLEVTAIQESLNTQRFVPLPKPNLVDLPHLKPAFSTLPPVTPKENTVATTKTPNLQKLLTLPLNERATVLIEFLKQSGLDVVKCIQDQITVIAGNQRGGKGTLMAVLAVLNKALEPQTKIHYFTAGDDIYPFKCDRLVCRLNFPKLDGTDADKQVAKALYAYLKAMDNATQGEYDDIILVIDEAVALSGYLDADQKEWMVKYLLTRASKKGAQIFIVLHGKHLSTWVGKSTNGMADTFKSGVSFVGCESTSIQISPLKKISVATGRYFLADPDSFDKPVKDGEIGMMPDWMKKELHPVNGQPDPARTLLLFFPELFSDGKYSAVVESESESDSVFESVDIVSNLESLLSLETKDVEIQEDIEEQFLERILEIVSKSNQPTSFNAIRISKLWEREWREKMPATGKLRRALNKLVQAERLKGDEKLGYALTNKNSSP